jgi:hypothetical protein
MMRTRAHGAVAMLLAEPAKPAGPSEGTRGLTLP